MPSKAVDNLFEELASRRETSKPFKKRIRWNANARP